MLAWTLAGLYASGVVDAVVVAVPPGRTDEVKLLFGADPVIVAGGVDRHESVRLGLTAIGDADCVLIHDGSRALTPASLIVRVVHALLAGHPAVVPALPLTDTIKVVDADGVVITTPERGGLRAVQTPQGIHADRLLLAPTAAAAGGFTGDSSPVEHIGGQAHLVDGDPLAFKISTPMDLLLAEAVLAGRT